MFSEVHKQRPRADDFFGDIPQCSNQTDVLLTSASDLETNVKSRGKVKKNIIMTSILDFNYYIFIYFIYTLSYILWIITLYNGIVAAYVPTLLIFDYYVTNIIQLFVVYKKLC